MLTRMAVLSTTAALLLMAGASVAGAQTSDAPAAAQPAPGDAPATPEATSPATTPKAEDGAGTPAPVAPTPEGVANAPQAPTTGEAASAASAADTLSPQIEDVQTLGPWTDGDKNGVWRAVMMQDGNDPDRYRFYVQQIEMTGSQMSLKSSTEIKEINKIQGTIVGYRADEPDDEDTNSLTLFFDIVPSEGEIAETYQLFFFQNQPYRFGPATN
ncbi:hypothetical protein NPA31_006980 [Aurantimonas sp. MSK8Z-1]|uniref:hypothetical protein n=1 Tax=Mangrovibrevibacter kandeliae TaxID=2968473 RepID=UPI002118A7CF|nr:hypothetical protein [Aurantimonas sp. MSK8Z-1]MCW4114704.1 hypothetical protein [Aurantimonas sp. MSK8Z-1]